MKAYYYDDVEVSPLLSLPFLPLYLPSPPKRARFLALISSPKAI